MRNRQSGLNQLNSIDNQERPVHLNLQNAAPGPWIGNLIMAHFTETIDLYLIICGSDCPLIYTN